MCCVCVVWVIARVCLHNCSEQKLLLHCRLELVSESSESGALSLSSAARHIDFHSSRRIYVVLVAHSIVLSLHYLLLYGGNVRIAALDQWRHSYFPRFGSTAANAKCSEPKIAAPQRTRTHVRESRVRRVIIEQRRAAYWFPLIAPYLCRPRSAFHSAFTTQSI